MIALSCLIVIWNLTFYSLKVWLKFKLPICGLKSHNAKVRLDSFLSYLILYFYVFCIFEKKNDIKVEQNYIFNSVFNRYELWNSNVLFVLMKNFL